MTQSGGGGAENTFSQYNLFIIFKKVLGGGAEDPQPLSLHGPCKRALE